MPQISMPYAVAKVKAMGAKMLGQAVMERAAAASSMEETLKIFADAGLPAESRAEAEQAAEKSVESACRAIRQLTAQPEVTDCFLYRYDGLNLKSLLKARSLGMEAPSLSQCGTVDTEKMRHAVAGADYRELPEFLRRAAEQAGRDNAEKFDPLRTDTRIDQAVYAHISAVLSKHKCPQVREYFRAEADMTNILIALRSRAIGWSEEVCRDMYVSGGELDAKELGQCVRDPEYCRKVAKGKAWEKSLTALTKAPISLPLLEKEADDYKMHLLRAHRHDVTGVLPLIGYLIARERESAAIRLILTARSANVPREILAERLREAYGR